MRTNTLDVATYADRWIRETEGVRDGKLFRRWMDYYEEQGIEEISAGLITMRRRDGDNWFYYEHDAPPMRGPAGDSILLGFAQLDFLQGAPRDEDLLTARLVRSPDLRLHQECEPGERGWQVVDARLQLTRGLAYSCVVDPLVAGLVAACDGTRTLGELLVAPWRA